MKVIACTPRPSHAEMLLLDSIEGLVLAKGLKPSEMLIFSDNLFLVNDDGPYLAQGYSFIRTKVSFKEFMDICRKAIKPKSWIQEDI